MVAKGFVQCTEPLRSLWGDFLHSGIYIFNSEEKK